MSPARPIRHQTSPGESLAFSDVHAPGCYVGRETGYLFRIPQEAVVEGRGPQIEIISRPPKTVTKIADDPWVPIGRARFLAADADLYVGF
ncbi:MAG: hypothetical protein ACE5HE_04795 [Phycisphaerae bacterium]